MTKGSSRRSILGALAAVTTLAAAPSVFLISGRAIARLADQSESGTVRWGLLVDVSRCTEDCSACVEACRAEHGWTGFGRAATDPQWIRKLLIKNRTTNHTVSLPVMCQHCESPPCADVCPTGASFRRTDGVVLVDRHTCIGCRYCMMACPYNARSFVHESLDNQKPHTPRGKGCVESCTLCAHRIDRNQQPACVERCTDSGHQALIFGNLNDQASEISRRLVVHTSTQIRSDLKTNPGIHYQGL